MNACGTIGHRHALLASDLACALERMKRFESAAALVIHHHPKGHCAGCLAQVSEAHTRCDCGWAALVASMTKLLSQGRKPA